MKITDWDEPDEDVHYKQAGVAVCIATVLATGLVLFYVGYTIAIWAGWL